MSAGAGTVRGGGSSLHSGIEFGRSRTGEGSSGGEEEGGGVRSGPRAARTILLFHTISAGPLNSLVWYVPSLRYTRGLGWRMHCGAEVPESSTNKQHHLSLHVPEQRLGRSSTWTRQQLVFISGENPFVPGHRDPTVPVTQCNGLCHVTIRLGVGIASV